MGTPAITYLAGTVLNLTDHKNKYVKEGITRFLFITTGSIAAIADIVDNVAEMGIKLPFTVGYATMGWVPIGKVDGKWKFLGSEWEERYKFSGQYQNIKYIFVSFLAIFILPVYGAWDPKECAKYYLHWKKSELIIPTPEIIVQNDEDPEDLSISKPSLFASLADRLKNADFSKLVIDSFFAEENIEHSDVNGYQIRMTENTMNSFETRMKYKNSFESHMDVLMSMKPMDENYVFDRSRLNENDIKNIATWEKMWSLNGDKLENIKKLFAESFYIDNSHVGGIFQNLSREILAALYWEEVARNEDLNGHIIKVEKFNPVDVVQAPIGRNNDTWNPSGSNFKAKDAYKNDSDVQKNQLKDVVSKFSEGSSKGLHINENEDAEDDWEYVQPVSGEKPSLFEGDPDLHKKGKKKMDYRPY